MEQTNNNAAQASLEDLKKGALEHYEEMATKCHHWYSLIPRAIQAYDPDAIARESIAFAEWIESDKCNYMFMASGTWCHTELKTNDLTTQQLYSLYKQSTNA